MKNKYTIFRKAQRAAAWPPLLHTVTSRVTANLVPMKLSAAQRSPYKPRFA